MQQSPYQQMAKEFMDLWQKQVASVMSDKDFIRAMLEMVKTMQTPYDATTAPSNPAPSADADPSLLAQLAFRVGMCERRIAELESKKSAGKRKPATAKNKTGAGKRSARPRR